MTGASSSRNAHHIHGGDVRPPQNLPPQATPLIGREAEVALIRTRLQRKDVRLLTLTGPGGTGKTRLALEVAAEVRDAYHDGAFFVPLAPVRDAALVSATIAQKLGLADSGGQPLLASIGDYLRDKHVLLVLDNFEHVIDAATVVADMLMTTPGLTVLATSREALKLYGEHVVLVPPLAVMPPKRLQQQGTSLVATLLQYEGVQLFVERAQAAHADFVLDEQNAPLIGELCYQLDGLPLAIELAAARIRLFSPQELLAPLGGRLQLLAGGPRNVPARQQTLRSTIAWSYELLSAHEQRLFRRLAVFAGGCTFHALEHVCFSDHNLATYGLDVVQALSDKSLVLRDRSQEQESRVQMLETIREYAVDQLALDDAAEVVRQQHCEYYLSLAEQSGLALKGPDQAAWLRRMESERANMRAALAWAAQRSDGELVLRLYVGMREFWWIGDLGNEAQWWREAAAPFIDKNIAPALRARALHLSGWLASASREFHDAERMMEESLALAKILDDRAMNMMLLKDLATTKRMQGHHERAAELFENALELARLVGDRWVENYVLGNLGMISLAKGETRRAEILFDEALAIARDLGHRGALEWWLAFLGRIAYDLADLPRAARYLREALDLFVEFMRRDAMAFTLEAIAGLAAAAGNARSAARLFGAVEVIREKHRIPLVAFDRPRYEQEVGAARSRLSKAVFESNWGEGRQLSLDQAIAQAALILSSVEQNITEDEASATFGLSEREVEVLQLVAQGLTNKEVAERLIISSHTVNMHLRSIFSKLDVTTRTEAARFAIKHDLV